VLSVVVALLMTASIVVLYATSLANESFGLVYRQLAAFGIGSVLYILFSLYDYHRLSSASRIAYVVFFLLLLIVLIFSREIRGSGRWIDFGPFQLQPAELVKIVVLLGVSRWLYIHRGQINSWTNIAITLLYAGLPAGLIMLQPDLGSSIVVMGIWFGLLLVSPIRKRFVLGLLLLAVVGAAIGWQFIFSDFQKDRVRTFLDPSSESRGRGYNVRQAIIAVGNGGLSGQGLGKGLQGQLKFLPERQTDFVFASLSEDFGFLGALAVLFLYYIVLSRLVRAMREAKDGLGRYITAGVFWMLLVQITINIGMNIGLLPVTGIPLPFLTYGGSSAVTVLAALGIAQNVIIQSKALRF
jgi:rod shape determining protein RodA